MPLCHAANASVLGPPSPVQRIRQQHPWSGGFCKEPGHPRRAEWHIVTAFENFSHHLSISKIHNQLQNAFPSPCNFIRHEKQRETYKTTSPPPYTLFRYIPLLTGYHLP